MPSALCTLTGADVRADVDYGSKNTFESPDVAHVGALSGADASGQAAAAAAAAAAPNDQISFSYTPPHEAFERFAGQMYHLPSNAESSRPWKPLETPVQRYARLKSEVEQFAQDMTRAAEIAESEGKVDESLRSVPEAMQEEIRALHSRLNSVLAPDSDGTGGAGKGAIPGAGQESLVQRLQTEVGSFSSITEKGGGGGGSGSGVGGGSGAASDLHLEGRGAAGKTSVTYSFYEPSGGGAAGGAGLGGGGGGTDPKITDAVALGRLEGRLASLEKLVGSADELSCFTPKPTPADAAAADGPMSMQTAVDELMRKVSLLDDNRLSGLLRKCDELGKELETLDANHGATLKSAHRDETVEAAFQTLSRWDAFSQELPAVIDRLHTLRGLHESAAHFASATADMSVRQKQLQEKMDVHQVALDSVSQSLEANMQTATGNVSELQARMDHIESRMAKLKV